MAKIEVGVTTFSHVISNFMPIEYGVSSSEMNSAFFEAVEFTFGHLKRLKNRYEYILLCRETVKKAMAEAKGVLLFEHSLPWMDNFFELGGEMHPAQFVIMPSGEHWQLRTIPPNLSQRMQVRKPLPAAWAGLQDVDLKNVSGIRGAVFCHKGRFISIWETKEDAILALNKVMEQKT